MSLERIEFDDGADSYNAYMCAQHLVRYASVRHLVKGKRVLDAACGSGYGVRLLSQWGAKSVVGVDNSPEAIASAKRNFPGKTVKFICGDAEDLDLTLGGEDMFDLATSFETIEHVSKPARLLQGLKNRVKRGGVIVISCPNDDMFKDLGMQSDFHVQSFSFKSFRALAETHLGKATGWAFGTPTYGEINYLPNRDDLESATPANFSIFKDHVVEQASLLPSQQNIMPNENLVGHFIGFWGADPVCNVVLTAQSVPAFIWPWKQVDRMPKLEAEIARLDGNLQEQRTKTLQLASQLSANKSTIAATEKTLSATEKTLASAQQALAVSQKKLADAQAMIAEFKMSFPGWVWRNLRPKRIYKKIKKRIAGAAG